MNKKQQAKKIKRAKKVKAKLLIKRTKIRNENKLNKELQKIRDSLEERTRPIINKENIDELS